MGPFQVCPGFHYCAYLQGRQPILTFCLIFNKFLSAKQGVFREGEKILLGENGGSAMWETVVEDCCSLC